MPMHARWEEGIFIPKGPTLHVTSKLFYTLTDAFPVSPGLRIKITVGRH